MVLVQHFRDRTSFNWVVSSWCHQNTQKKRGLAYIWNFWTVFGNFAIIVFFARFGVRHTLIVLSLRVNMLSYALALTAPILSRGSSYDYPQNAQMQHKNTHKLASPFRPTEEVAINCIRRWCWVDSGTDCMFWNVCWVDLCWWLSLIVVVTLSAEFVSLAQPYSLFLSAAFQMLGCKSDAVLPSSSSSSLWSFLALHIADRSNEGIAAVQHRLYALNSVYASA